MPLVLSGSLDISGSLTVTQNVVFQQTSSLQATASWAENVVGGSSVLAVTGSTIYSVNPATSNVNPNQGVFIGTYAGENAPNAEFSIFVGNLTGYNAGNAKLSNFIGITAGDYAYNASGSNFIGAGAGSSAQNAAYSNIMGYNAGYSDGTGNSIGRNNIVIGTSVTLGVGRKDSINIGGLIFGTGSYFDLSTISSGSANGKVGVNQPLPVYSLDVSGSGNYSNGLTATGSLKITGSITVNDKVSNVLSVTGSSLYSAPSTRQVGTDNGIFIGFGAGQETNNISPFGDKGNECVFVGNYAGYQAQITRYSTFLGYYSGFQAYQVDYGTFLGHYAGNLADAADYSTMIGASAGDSAIQASNSVIIGSNAGASATNAAKSVFVGNGAGNNASTSSYSTFLGYQAGKTSAGNGPGRNNIVIGSNISLEAQRQDSINIGGLIFGTGSYYNASDIVSSGSANGKIGVNQPLPQYSLDVSGSIGLTDLFVLASKDTLPVSNVPSGSIMASGSGADFKPYFWNGATWTSLI